MSKQTFIVGIDTECKDFNEWIEEHDRRLRREALEEVWERLQKEEIECEKLMLVPSWLSTVRIVKELKECKGCKYYFKDIDAPEGSEDCHWSPNGEEDECPCGDK